jgi:hypothetical protein
LGLSFLDPSGEQHGPRDGQPDRVPALAVAVPLDQLVSLGHSVVVPAGPDQSVHQLGHDRVPLLLADRDQLEGMFEKLHRRPWKTGGELRGRSQEPLNRVVITTGGSPDQMWGHLDGRCASRRERLTYLQMKTTPYRCWQVEVDNLAHQLVPEGDMLRGLIEDLRAECLVEVVEQVAGESTQDDGELGERERRPQDGGDPKNPSRGVWQGYQLPQDQPAEGMRDRPDVCVGPPVNDLQRSGLVEGSDQFLNEQRVSARLCRGCQQFCGWRRPRQSLHQRGHRCIVERP